VIALATTVVAVGVHFWRSSPDGHWGDVTTPANHPTIAGSSDQASDLSSGDEQADPDKALFVPRADGTARIAGVARAGVAHRDFIADRATSEPARLSDDDVTLFASLERLERRIAVAVATARESVVALEYTSADRPPGARRLASGVVINLRGEVLSIRIDPPPVPGTDATAREMAVIVARDFSGRRHTVQWVAADCETGLTLLRLTPRAVRPIRTAMSAPSLGSQVFVVGNPFGMRHSVSRGHVAGLDRMLELSSQQLGGLIQVHAPLYPGDSGAALINLKGDWLGLIRSGLAMPCAESGPGTASSLQSTSGLSPSFAPTEVSIGQTERDSDFGFAIPAHDALWVADQLRARGRIDRAYLGVRIEPSLGAGTDNLSESSQRLERALDAVPTATSPELPSQRATHDALDLARDGALLREVLPSTPASAAGLRPGDRIVGLDGQRIRSAHDLTGRLTRVLANTTIQLDLVRANGSKRQRISVLLCTGTRPGGPRLAGSRSNPSFRSELVSASAVPPSSGSLAGSPPVLPSSPENRERSGRLAGAVASPQPNELHLTLPRAVVERLETLERRLEKLESSPGRAQATAAPPDRQISSARIP
jgi:S1-C subfamily serine protease